MMATPKTAPNVDYEKLCNNTIKIQNNHTLMYVERCTRYIVTFVLITEVPKEIDPETEQPMHVGKKEVNRFDFDFRYYSPYTGQEFKKPGVYVFKTADNDSHPI